MFKPAPEVQEVFVTPTVKLVHHSAHRNPDAEPQPAKLSTEADRPAAGPATLSAAPAPPDVLGA